MSSPAQQPSASPPASGVMDRLPEIDADAGEAARARAARDRHYHTRLVPALRLGGIVLLGFLVWLHNRYRLGGAPRPGYELFLLALVGYAGVSWLLLDRLYLRVRAFNLGTFFLGLDLAWFAAAVFFSGGSHSWLFFVLLVRVADQTATTFRNVLVFAHLCVGSYLGVLLVQWLATSDPLNLRVEVAKSISLYVTALYIATTARTAEALRRRGTRAIRDARALIEQLREQTAALERARARAEEMNRAKSEFFANLSHELRTPLAASLGFLDLVLDSELTDEQRDYLGHVATANRNLHGMLEQMMDLARLESNSLAMARVPVDLPALAEAVLGGIAAAAAAKGLAVERQLAGAPATLTGDPVRLRQVLGSLLGNAVKFTARGRISLRIEAHPQAQPPEVVFTVSDTGVGIPADRLGDLFALQQLDGSSTRRAGGLGLGLALTSRLVAAMKGRLWVESSVGEGSHFHVALPLG